MTVETTRLKTVTVVTQTNGHKQDFNRPLTRICEHLTHLKTERFTLSETEGKEKRIF